MASPGATNLISIRGNKRFLPEVFENFALEPSLSSLVVESYEGDIDRGSTRFEGEGIAIFRSGDEYTGSFRLGMMHGLGKYTWKNGTVYTGTFKANEIDGIGRYTWPDGSMYEGDVKKGLRHGQGTFTSNAGFSKYEGDWKAGKRHGKGKLYYDVEGKCYYEGQWLANMRDGKGKMVYASGNVYDGEWKHDRKNGYGVMQWLDRREQYAGHWVGDQQEGVGEHVWMDDAKPAEASVGIMKQMCNLYRGEWRKGERQGEGTFFYSNGAKYSGQWQHNQKEGYGVFVFEDGHMYEGPFSKDKMVKIKATTGRGIATAAATAALGGQAGGTGAEVRPPSTAASKQSENGQQRQQKMQLYLDVLDLLPCAACDVGVEIARLEKLALQYNTDLKRIYKKYCAMDSTGDSNDTGSAAPAPSYTMGVKEFKRLCQDCQMMGDLVPSTLAIDTILYNMRRHHFYQIQSIIHRRQRMLGATTTSNSHQSEGDKTDRWIPTFNEELLKSQQSHAHSLLFREFFEALVRLAHHVYSIQAPELNIVEAAKKLIVERVAPFVKSQTQDLGSSSVSSKIAGGSAAGTSTQHHGGRSHHHPHLTQHHSSTRLHRQSSNNSVHSTTSSTFSPPRRPSDGGGRHSAPSDTTNITRTSPLSETHHSMRRSCTAAATATTSSTPASLAETAATAATAVVVQQQCPLDDETLKALYSKYTTITTASKEGGEGMRRSDYIRMIRDATKASTSATTGAADSSSGLMMSVDDVMQVIQPLSSSGRYSADDGRPSSTGGKEGVAVAGMDLTALKRSMSLDDLKQGISQLYQDVNRREEMKALGDLTSVASIAEEETEGEVVGTAAAAPTTGSGTDSAAKASAEWMMRSLRQLVSSTPYLA